MTENSVRLAFVKNGRNLLLDTGPHVLTAPGIAIWKCAAVRAETAVLTHDIDGEVAKR